MIKKRDVLLFFVLMLLNYGMVKAQSVNLNPTISMQYENVFLEGDRSDWKLGSLWYKHPAAFLTTIIKLQYANRFSENTYRTQVDFYPHISAGSYARISAGTSLTRRGLFPNYNAAAIYYQNLSSAVVGAAGIRYQSFDKGNAFIFNTRLHWYFGDYLLMGQAFFQKPKEKIVSTGVLTLRKYLNYPTYLFAKIAYGQAPQGLRFEEDVFNSYESYFFSIGGEFLISRHWSIAPVIKFRRSTYNISTSRYRIGVMGRISYLF